MSGAYASTCRQAMEAAGVRDARAAAWLESYMRCEWGTLDHLPRAAFLKKARELALGLSEAVITIAELDDLVESFEGPAILRSERSE